MIDNTVVQTFDARSLLAARVRRATGYARRAVAARYTVVFRLALTAVAGSAAASVVAPARADEPASPTSAATIFEAARQYTVQVRAVVSDPFGSESTGVNLGAGFVVDAARGWVMTNAHVVGRSPSRVAASFQGERFAAASKHYVDPLLDLAIVALGRPVDAGRESRLDCGAPPATGHPVGAFGHPRGMKYTGTRGILSRIARNAGYELLQIDAAVNGGNSGGPLLSLASGRVIGINTSKLAGAEGLNFALPARYACRLLALLRDGASPLPPELPLRYYEDADERGELKVAAIHGAAGAGFRVGDVLLGPDPAHQVFGEVALLDSLRGLDAFTIYVRRDGEIVPVPVRTRAMPSPMAREGLAFGGLVITETDDDEGPLVTVEHVHKGSDAEAQGFRYRDVLHSLDGRRIESLADLRERLRATGGNAQFVTVRGWFLPVRMRKFYEKTLAYDAVKRVSGS